MDNQQFNGFANEATYMVYEALTEDRHHDYKLRELILNHLGLPRMGSLNQSVYDHNLKTTGNIIKTYCNHSLNLIEAGKPLTKALNQWIKCFFSNVEWSEISAHYLEDHEDFLQALDWDYTQCWLIGLQRDISLIDVDRTDVRLRWTPDHTLEYGYGSSDYHTDHRGLWVYDCLYMSQEEDELGMLALTMIRQMLEEYQTAEIESRMS